MSENSVRVAVRVRGLSDKEREQGATECIMVDGRQVMASLEDVPKDTLVSASARKRGKKSFSFDFCYGGTNTQEDVFEDIGKAVLENTFAGYNSSVFAYGQTGSGKTHTMLGEDGREGLIPRICAKLVSKLGTRRLSDTTDLSLIGAASTRYRLEASYLEIYNEKCLDLLKTDKKDAQDLRIREHPKHGPYVEGLTSRAIVCMEEIEEIMEVGAKARTTAATNMNAKSSRSHAIFTLVFTQTNISSDMSSATDTVSKINLVDLAGSERVNASGVQGKQLKEAANINRSLHSLGRVISALSKKSEPKGLPLVVDNDENQSSNVDTSVVPYRDSTLTWLLKPSLGGNSKTTMLATVSPASYNFEESMTTLRYAQECARVVNKAVINRDSNKAVIDELREEIELLRERLKIQTDTNEELEERKRAAEQEHVEYKNAIQITKQHHKQEVQALETTIAENQAAYETRLHEQKNKIENLSSQLKTTSQKLHKEKTMLETVSKERETLETDIAEKHKFIESLEKQMESMEIAKVGFEAEIDSLTLALNRANADLEEKIKELEHAKKKQGQAIAELQEQLRVSRDETDSITERLSSKCDTLSQSVATLTKDKQELEEKCDRLDGALRLSQEGYAEAQRNFDQQMAKAQHEKSALESGLNGNISKLESHVAELEQQIEQHKKDAELQQNTLESLSGKNSELQAILVSSQSDGKHLSAKLEKMESELDSTRQELTSLQQNHDTLNTQYQQSIEEKLTLSKTIEEHSSQIVDLEKARDGLSDDLNVLRGEHALLANDKSTLRAQMDELSKELRKEQGRATEIQSELGSKSQELVATEGKMKELSKALEEQGTAFAELQSHFDKLTSELETAKRQIYTADMERASWSEDREILNLEIKKKNQNFLDLKSAFEKQSLENQSMTGTIEQLEGTLRERETELQQVTSERDTAATTAKIDREALAKQLQDTKNESATQMTTMKAMHEDAMARMGSELATSKSRITELEGYRNELQDANANLESKLQDGLEENHHLEVRIEEECEISAKLRRGNQDLITQLSELRKELATVKTQMKMAENEITVERETLRNMEAELHERSENLNEIEAFMFEEKRQFRILEAEAAANLMKAQEIQEKSSEESITARALMSQVEQRTADLDQVKARLDADTDKNLKTIKNACIQQMLSQFRQRALMDAKDAEHRKEFNGLLISHGYEISQLMSEHEAQVRRMRADIVELQSNLITEKAIQRESAQRYARMLQAEDEELDAKVAQATAALKELEAKKQQTRESRTMAEEALRLTESKALETQSATLSSKMLESFKFLIELSGLIIKKYTGGNRKPSNRYMYLAREDGDSYLYIYKRKKTNFESVDESKYESKMKISRKDMIVQPGIHTEKFKDFAKENNIGSELCFYVLDGSRSWEFVCRDKYESRAITQSLWKLVDSFHDSDDNETDLEYLDEAENIAPKSSPNCTPRPSTKKTISTDTEEESDQLTPPSFTSMIYSMSPFFERK